MKIKSILVSQPKPAHETSPYYEISKKNKINIDFRPFIQVEGLNPRAIREQKVDFSKFTAIIFTSRNAVDHFFRLAEEMRFPVPDAMKYFCQSEAIAHYLQKYITYRKRKVSIAKRTFEDLIPLIEKNKNEKFLLPGSDIMKTQMIRMMNKTKVTWSKVVLYKTVCSDLSDLKEVDYDILVFFSPSGIKSLFENFPDFEQRDTKIAAYGKTTVQAAEKMGLQIDIKVPTPESPSMTMALEKYLKNSKN